MYWETVTKRRVPDKCYSEHLVMVGEKSHWANFSQQRQTFLHQMFLLIPTIKKIQVWILYKHYVSLNNLFWVAISQTRKWRIQVCCYRHISGGSWTVKHDEDSSRSDGNLENLEPQEVERWKDQKTDWPSRDRALKSNLSHLLCFEDWRNKEFQIPR